MIWAVSSSSARVCISSLLFSFNHCLVAEYKLCFTLAFTLFKLYMVSSKLEAYNSKRIEQSLSHFSIVKLSSAIHLIVSLMCIYADCSIKISLVSRSFFISSLSLVILSFRDLV